MHAYLHESVPLVAVYNNLEVAFSFLSRANDAAFIETRRYRGDRALLWLGDPKLVFTTAPIPYAKRLCQRWGYPGTHTLCPANPSHQLSLDILREPDLLAQLIEYAGPKRTVQLVPYATTPEFLQLAETLRTEHGLTALLPESPPAERLWVRDYIDTKTGFRVLTSQWLSDSTLLPFGIVCQDMQQAAEAIRWFNANGQICVVKSNSGESGLGHMVLSPEENSVPAKYIRTKLWSNRFLRDDLIVVERYINSSGRLSPSLEMFVPPLGIGEPEITYLSNQLFGDFGRFAGVLVSRELPSSDWYPLLAESGLKIAERLQEMGYVGHFDLDTIVDDEGRLFLLEVNARRTGGTHVHEFARFTFGPDYLDEVALLSHNSFSSEGITHPEELLHAVGDLLYPMNHERRGVVITVTSALTAQRFGCVIVASSAKEALALQEALSERLRKADKH
ncbi:MAG: hypothetical protein JXA14_09900 [Anaerolineae bacterium]|nr:hypothetical protein [Anaerolineae bacterium]